MAGFCNLIVFVAENQLFGQSSLRCKQTKINFLAKIVQRIVNFQHIQFFLTQQNVNKIDNIMDCAFEEENKVESDCFSNFRNVNTLKLVTLY